MSNTSIAVLPTVCGRSCVDAIQSMRPDWRISMDAPVFDPDANVLISQGPNATAIWLRFPQIESWKIYSKVSEELQCKWLLLLFQEHVVWEYNLYDKVTLLDRFAPVPSLWNESWRPPNVNLLVDLWKINPRRINAYLKLWNERLKGRKAYLFRDQFRFGQYEQGFDFLKALTSIEFPN